MAYKAGSIGSGRDTVIKVFEEKYEEGMSLEKAIALGVEALAKATEGEMKVEAIEIGLVTTTEPFQKLPQKEVEKYAKDVEKYVKEAIKTEDKEKK
jgi:proteasome alpha subunit